MLNMKAECKEAVPLKERMYNNDHRDKITKAKWVKWKKLELKALHLITQSNPR